MRMLCVSILLAATAGAQEIEGIDRVPEAARGMLVQNGFVVAGECTQVFTPYVEPDGPVFITTDAIAHGYAVALRALVRRMDRIAAGELRGFGARLAAGAQRRRGEADVFREVFEIAAVACTLGDAPFVSPGWPNDVTERIVQVAARLRAADGPPILFGGATLRPERFRPVAGYDRDDELRAVWRVRTFWSELALRLDRPRSRGIAYALCQLVAADPELRRLAEELAEPFDDLLGLPDDPDLRMGIEVLAEVGDAAGFADRLAALRRPALDLEELRLFRVFGARRTPDGAALYRAGSARRDLASGIDLLLVGPLRSETGGVAWRAEHGGEPVTAGLHEVVPVDPGPGAHGDLLRALQHLVGQPVAGAPDWMRGTAWGRKQAWTQLGAWAEVRHAWALHSKRAYTRLIRGDVAEVGVVAPYPQFFAAMARLAEDVADRVVAWEFRQVVFLRGARARLRRLAAVCDGERGGASGADLIELYALAARGRRVGLLDDADDARAWRDDLMPEPLVRAAEVDPGRATAEQLELLRLTTVDSLDPVERLRELAVLARTCARLAETSWAEDGYSDEDRDFVPGLGGELAFVCGYESPMHPEDDAPVIVTVAETQGVVGGDLALQVGVGRPERLWALVPVGDRLVLVEGAVLSYREARVPLGRGETDDEAWRDAARAGELPEPPAFTDVFRVGR